MQWEDKASDQDKKELNIDSKTVMEQYVLEVYNTCHVNNPNEN